MYSLQLDMVIDAGLSVLDDIGMVGRLSKQRKH